MHHSYSDPDSISNAPWGAGLFWYSCTSSIADPRRNVVFFNLCVFVSHRRIILPTLTVPATIDVVGYLSIQIDILVLHQLPSPKMYFFLRLSSNVALPSAQLPHYSKRPVYPISSLIRTPLLHCLLDCFLACSLVSKA